MRKRRFKILFRLRKIPLRVQNSAVFKIIQHRLHVARHIFIKRVNFKNFRFMHFAFHPHGIKFPERKRIMIFGNQSKCIFINYDARTVFLFLLPVAIPNLRCRRSRCNQNVFPNRCFRLRRDRSQFQRENPT